MKWTSRSPEAGDLEAGMDVNAVGSQVPFYDQVYANLKSEMEVITRFLMKLEVSKEEGKTIHDAATLKIVRDTMEKEVKEVSETAQSIIEKLEQLDTVHASNKGCKQDSPTDQCFRNMRNSYITQVEEVLNVVTSLAGVEPQSTDGEDSFTYSWSDTDSMISMRKRLEGLRMVDSLAGVEIQRVDTPEVHIIQLQGVAKRFSYDELHLATRGFSEKLGDGGFGSVYRGVLPPRIPVAVKRMNVDSTHGQGMKEFKGEVSIITQLRHRNLIELRGWCEDQARREYMLVYELMPNGSLDNLLFKHSAKRGGAAGEEGTKARGGKGRVIKGIYCLSWPQRFNILTGIADALDYLHQGWKHQVIHGDIKCANILLDKEWNAKLTDFGLSRLVDHQGEAYTIHFAGTRGYAAPELFTEGKFTDKSDVFAFGAVVLEVVCGRRNWPGDAHEMSLVEWVRERLSKGDLISIVDKELRGFDRHQMETVLMIGLACFEIDHRKRPSMRLVVKMLAGERYDDIMKMMVVKEKAEDIAGPSKEAPDGEDLSTSHALNVDFEAKDQESENIAYVLPPPPPPLLPPLPPKWKEAIDFATGHRYYYNPETNESSWERPKAGIVIADQNKKPENSSTGPRELPPYRAISEFREPAPHISIEKGKNIVDHEETVNSEGGSSNSSQDHETQLKNDNRSESKKTWWEPFGAPFFKLGRQAFQKQSPIVQLEGMPKRFSYRQLSVATGGFSEESKLGSGGFGSVYRGVLPSGVQVAVKRLRYYYSRRDADKFTTEVSILCQVRHRSVIRLLGWCDDHAAKQQNKPCLVYELMPNRSLRDVLFEPYEKGISYLSWPQSFDICFMRNRTLGDESFEPAKKGIPCNLFWPQRFDILTAIAAGLDYLHEGLKQQVIHRNLNSASILLDDECNAKLGDFGLWREDFEVERSDTYLQRTIGHLSPEFIITGEFTSKSDVFAFGVVVLEVICRRKVLCFDVKRGEQFIVDWVWQRLKEGDLMRAVDSRLEDYDTYQAKVVLKIGLLCCLTNPEARPSMRQVVEMLAGDVPVPTLPPSKGRTLGFEIGVHWCLPWGLPLTDGDVLWYDVVSDENLPGLI